MNEIPRPIPECCAAWWEFCQKNSKNLTEIPTFEQFKQSKFNFKNSDLI